MKINHCLTSIPLLFFLACKNQNNVGDSPTGITNQPDTMVSKAPRLSVLDTTIFLSGTEDSYIPDKNLSEKEAEKLLYDYFKQRGVRSRNNPGDTLSNSTEIPVVDYDTIYRLRADEFTGAIISYWLGPADLNGRCFQPGKAVILNTKKGYKITNIGFIPTNFAIDSVVKQTIYGYDYDCGGKGIIRGLKMTLQQK